MKIKALAAAVVITMSSGAVLAQDYRFEVGAGYTNYDVDNFGSEDFFGAYGTHYFAPVQTAARPLAEAAFLGKSSNVSVFTEFDADLIGADVEFYIPNSIFYVGATAVRLDDGDETDNDWVARVGITPIDGLLVTTSFNDEDYDLNLAAKYVAQLGGGNFLNIEAYFYDGGDFDDSTGVFADFYFNRTFSVGVGYEEDGEDAFTVRTRKFFTESFSAEASYTKHDRLSVANVGVSLRF